jgi:hypothetical protein
MREHMKRIVMACFVEGIPLARLALAPHHLAQGEAFMAEMQGECDSDTYCRCLEALLQEEKEGGE